MNSPTQTTRNFPLPPEIIGEIAAHAASPSKSISLLKQCCLISRDFRAQFQPYIFQFLDMEDDPDSVLRWSERKLTSHLLECIERNPALATYVKQVWLSLDSGQIAQDPLLPRFIRQLPVIRSLQVGAYDPGFRWGQLAPDLQAAIIDTCQLPTLRYLHLNSVSDIPISLVTNTNLRKLELYNIQSFCDFGKLFKTEDGEKSLEDSRAVDSGPFTSVRTLTCGYLGTRPKGCLYSIVESSAMAVSLSTLRIMLLIDPESTGTFSFVVYLLSTSMSTEWNCNRHTFSDRGSVLSFVQPLEGVEPPIPQNPVRTRSAFGVIHTVGHRIFLVLDRSNSRHSRQISSPRRN